MWNPALISGPRTIYRYGPPVTDGDGTDHREVIGTVPGYHLDVAPQLITEDLQVFALEPVTPSSMFAGGATAYLKFTDEAEARSFLPDQWSEDDPDL